MHREVELKQTQFDATRSLQSKESEFSNKARSPNPSKTSIRLKAKILKGNINFLHGVVRSVLKVFAKLFSKKLAAGGTDKSKFEI